MNSGPLTEVVPQNRIQQWAHWTLSLSLYQSLVLSPFPVPQSSATVIPNFTPKLPFIYIPAP